jgi:UDP-N-acetylmuramoyl-tripeptide--D-alanyl-D-alanine ligase
VIVVRETLAALGDLAARIAGATGPLVAVAGSGKTTTKEMLATILRAAYGEDRVVATRGSQNNLVGLPLTLLRVDDETRVVVLEIGMNAPGEVWRLAEIAQPDVGLITCIAEEHLQGVGSIRGAAEANAELWRRLTPSGTAIVNADDPHLRAVENAFEGRRISYQEVDDVRARRRRRRHRRHALRRSSPGGGRRSGSASPAGTTCERARRDRRRAASACRSRPPAALETFTAPTMRMQRLTLASGVVVLNDCYNANPARWRPRSRRSVRAGPPAASPSWARC